MSYKMRTTERFDKQLSKLDKFAGRMILKWLAKNIDGTTNPRATGKGLEVFVKTTISQASLINYEDNE